jgi:hypothetical protein
MLLFYDTHERTYFILTTVGSSQQTGIATSMSFLLRHMVEEYGSTIIARSVDSWKTRSTHAGLRSAQRKNMILGEFKRS